MALIIENKYPGKSNAADANYPFGSARNITTPGDGTGTPLEQAWVNDLFGFQQALLGSGGVTPSGNVDTVLSSDYLDALLNVIAVQVGALTGDTLGVKTTNDAATNTTNMTAAQTLAQAEGKPILLTPGAYLINEFTLKAGVKILSLGTGDIEFQNVSAPMIRLEGGVVHNGTGFHGTLNCTGVSGVSASGLLLLDSDGTTIEDVNFDHIRFKGLAFGVNGALIVAGNSGGTNHSYIKSWSMRFATYQTGRMGCEFLNQSADAVITNVTIGADATFTATGLFAEEGQTVLLEDLVGDAIVEGLNGALLIVTNVSGGTFQLKDTDGVKVATTGGTYTSGGALRVFRGEDIDLTGSKFLQTGAVSASLGMGFSGDNALLNVDLSRSVFQDTPQYGAELIGLAKCNLSDASFLRCTGDPISTSNKFGYGNIITGCSTVGAAAGRVFIAKQKHLIWRDNDISAISETSFTEVSESQIRGGRITSRGTVAAIFDQSPNNEISDITLDNSESSSNFSCLRFFGAATVNNRARNVTILKGSGGANTDQASGAAGNTVESYRTSIGGEFDQGLPDPAPAFGTFGSVGNWPRLPSSEIRELNDYNASTGVTSYRVKLLRTTGNAQVTSEFEFRFAGRNNNIPVGGKFGVSFGSANDFDATPAFWSLGAAATLAAVQIDGSGFPYWDITLPTNNGSMLAVVQAAVRNDSDAAEWEITLIP